MFPFSETTLTYLHKAGWSEDRVFDTSEYERLLKEAGYPVFPVVCEFLHSFGGLQLIFPDVYEPEIKTYCDFFYRFTAPKQIQEYSEQVGTPLCPIGNCDHHGRTLLMDASGRTYSAFRAAIYLVAQSGQEAIEVICNALPRTLLHPERYQSNGTYILDALSFSRFN